MEVSVGKHHPPNGRANVQLAFVDGAARRHIAMPLFVLTVVFASCRTIAIIAFVQPLSMVSRVNRVSVCTDH